jgi:hypothetical protein
VIKTACLMSSQASRFREKSLLLTHKIQYMDSVTPNTQPKNVVWRFSFLSPLLLLKSRFGSVYHMSVTF